MKYEIGKCYLITHDYGFMNSKVNDKRIIVKVIDIIPEYLVVTIIKDYDDGKYCFRSDDYVNIYLTNIEKVEELDELKLLSMVI